IARLGEDVFFGMLDQGLERYGRGSAVARQLYEQLMLRYRRSAAGRGSDLQEPVAAARQRHSPGFERLAGHRNRIGDAAPDGDDGVRLQCLWAELFLDRALALGRGAPGRRDAAGIGDADPA